MTQDHNSSNLWLSRWLYQFCAHNSHTVNFLREPVSPCCTATVSQPSWSQLCDSSCVGDVWRHSFWLLWSFWASPLMRKTSSSCQSKILIKDWTLYFPDLQQSVCNDCCRTIYVYSQRAASHLFNILKFIHLERTSIFSAKRAYPAGSQRKKIVTE